MIRPALLAALALQLAPSPASVQRARPIPAPVRDGGTLHAATGAWTRKAGGAALGPDVLYDNTCGSRYYSTLSGDTFVDEGRVPGTASPDDAASKPGCAASYAIDGFQVAYCTDQPTAAFTYAFFDSYTACATTSGLTPAGSFALSSLPGAGGTALACWTVAVDVAATPFALSAGPTNPRFGFSMSSPQTSVAHGPMIAGDPNACARWDGTSWDPVLDLAEAGTGMGTLNQFRIELGPSWNGCFFFGGDPYASFWLELYGTTCAPSGPGASAFCVAGAPGATPCPCGNEPPAGSVAGCRHSGGVGAILSATGSSSLSADTLVLVGAQMPPSSPVLYFQGTLQQNAGWGTVFGDGLRCAGGVVVRLGVAINSGAGASSYPQGAQLPVSVRGGVSAPGARSYQAWFRNVAPFCTPAGFNTSNGLQVFWGV